MTSPRECTSRAIFLTGSPFHIPPRALARSLAGTSRSGHSSSFSPGASSAHRGNGWLVFNGSYWVVGILFIYLLRGEKNAVWTMDKWFLRKHFFPCLMKINLLALEIRIRCATQVLCGPSRYQTAQKKKKKNQAVLPIFSLKKKIIRPSLCLWANYSIFCIFNTCVLAQIRAKRKKNEKKKKNPPGSDHVKELRGGSDERGK